MSVESTCTLVDFGKFTSINNLSVTFKEDIPETGRCVLCKSVAGILFPGSCLHSLCRECLCKLNRSDVFCCPVDEKETTAEELWQCEFSNWIVLKLTVKCVNERNGCTFVGLLSDLNIHLRSCGQEMLECSYCDNLFAKAVILEHILNECPKRLCSCPNCDISVPVSSLEEHKESCPKRKVTCSFCNELEIYHDELESHLKACPRNIHLCRYAEFGCTYKGRKEDLDDHETPACHLELFFQELRNIKASKKTLQDECTELQAKVRALEENEKVLRSECDSLKKLLVATVEKEQVLCKDFEDLQSDFRIIKEPFDHLLKELK